MSKPKILVLLFLLESLAVSAQNIDRPILFGDREPIPIRLNFSIKDMKKVKEDTVYTTSMMHYQGKNGWDSLSVDLRARGHFRRGNCFFPPIKIKVKNSATENTPFEGNKNLKLVVPCQGSKPYSDLILKEFMCYKFYEVISPYHFNTRLAELNLIDDKGKSSKSYDLSAFFIEDDDLVAKRHKGKIMDELKLHPFQMADTITLKQDFFQYMISNADWSSVQQHNVKIIQLKTGKNIPVPYDFDMSGVVNAPYSTVSELLETTTVSERVYRGFCWKPELFEYVRKEYLQKESSIKNVINQFEGQLPAKEIAGLHKYIDEFFAILKNDKAFNENIIEQCRTK